jgi:hypothetical protein
MQIKSPLLIQEYTYESELHFFSVLVSGYLYRVRTRVPRRCINYAAEKIYLHKLE